MTMPEKLTCVAEVFIRSYAFYFLWKTPRMHYSVVRAQLVMISFHVGVYEPWIQCVNVTAATLCSGVPAGVGEDATGWRSPSRHHETHHLHPVLDAGEAGAQTIPQDAQLSDPHTGRNIASLSLVPWFDSAVMILFFLGLFHILSKCIKFSFSKFFAIDVLFSVLLCPSSLFV